MNPDAQADSHHDSTFVRVRKSWLVLFAYSISILLVAWGMFHGRDELTTLDVLAISAGVSMFVILAAVSYAVRAARQNSRHALNEMSQIVFGPVVGTDGLLGIAKDHSESIRAQTDLIGQVIRDSGELARRVLELERSRDAR